MPAVSISRSGYRQRTTLRSRLTSLALALALVMLVIALLIQLGVLPPPKPHDLHPLTAFDFVPLPPTPTPAVRRAPPAGSAPPKAAPSPKPTPAAPAPATPLIQLSEADFAASDIGKIAPAPSGADNDGAGTGKDSVAAYGPGEGPGGEPLYHARWYRHPSHAQMAAYLPTDGPDTGFAVIACRTIADYHVDNCRILGETPGSGFGTAMRRAAWQFLIRPPRLGGKSLIGGWVEIDLTITSQGIG